MYTKHDMAKLYFNSYHFSLSLFSFFFFSLMQTNVVNVNDCFTHFFWVYNQSWLPGAEKSSRNLFFSSKPVTSTQFLLKMLYFFFSCLPFISFVWLISSKNIEYFCQFSTFKTRFVSDYDFLPHPTTLIAFNNVEFYEAAGCFL